MLNHWQVAAAAKTVAVTQLRQGAITPARAEEVFDLADAVEWEEAEETQLGELQQLVSVYQRIILQLVFTVASVAALAAVAQAQVEPPTPPAYVAQAFDKAYESRLKVSKAASDAWDAFDFAIITYSEALLARETCSDPVKLQQGDALMVGGIDKVFGDPGPSFRSEAQTANGWLRNPQGTGGLDLYDAAIQEWHNGNPPDWPAVAANFNTAKIRFDIARGHYQAALPYATNAETDWRDAADTYYEGYQQGGSAPPPPGFTLPEFGSGEGGQQDRPQF